MTLPIRYRIGQAGIYKSGLVQDLGGMLMLLFHVGDECWAIAADETKHLISRVALQPFSISAQSIAGLLNYHKDTALAIVEATAEMTAGLILDRAYERANLSEAARTVPSNLPGGQGAYVHAIWKGPGGGVIRQLAIVPFLTAQASERISQRTQRITDESQNMAPSVHTKGEIK